MTESRKPKSYVGDPSAPVPEGHQGTWRPTDDPAVAEWAHEPVPADAQPDASEPTTQAGLDAHAAMTAMTAAAFRAEHDAQLQAQHEAEIAAAGRSGNIGTDGKPHFLKMIPKEGRDVGDGDHDPEDFNSVCGTDGQSWPCEQGRALEDAARIAHGLEPLPGD